jgi:hypothetical protein
MTGECEKHADEAVKIVTDLDAIFVALLKMQQERRKKPKARRAISSIFP